MFVVKTTSRNATLLGCVKTKIYLKGKGRTAERNAIVLCSIEKINQCAMVTLPPENVPHIAL